MTRIPGCCLRTASICFAVKRSCTEQWPFHRIIFARCTSVGIETAEDLVRIPHDHLIERNAHLVGGVAPEVLVGHEENPLAALERPLQRRHRVRRRADGAAALADERLNRRRRIDVGHRHDAGDAHLLQLFPARLELLRLDHVGHRAAGGQVRQDDLLMRRGQDVRAFRHEVHAAEHDVVGVRPLRHLTGKTERVAGVVGELDHFVALIVMTENDELVAERRASRGNAGSISASDRPRYFSGSAWRSEMCSFSNSVSSGMIVATSACSPSRPVTL